MEIKSNKTENLFNKSIQMVHSKIILLVFTWILLISVAFFAGALTQRVGLLTKPSMFRRALLENPLSFALTCIRARLANPERIYIDIDYKDFQKLTYWRRLALENKTLYSIAHDYVQAQIRHGNEIVPASIRLKGAVAEQHMAGEKWSLRVRIRGNKTLFGMKEFALMDPKRRSHLHTWIIRQAFRKEGVISKRYKFIEVIINGENKGIYAMDEHLGKVMLEAANQRREGPIIRLSQVPIWVEKAAFNFSPAMSNVYYLSADIDAIDSGKIKKNETLLRQFVQAHHLFNAFRNGDLPAHEVFDTDKLAKWMAVSNVMGAWHGVGDFGISFYYNPVTSKLEPVPDDEYDENYKEDVEERFFSLHHMNEFKFFNQLFNDLSFMEKYLQNLERVSRKSYMDDILGELSEEIDQNLHIIQKDDLYYNSPREQLYKSQEYIHGILNPYKGITAYFKEVCPKGLMLRIANVKEIPMEILNVSYNKNTVLKPAQGRIVLRGKDSFKPLLYDEIEFSFPDGFNGVEAPSELIVNYKLLGTSRLRSEPVIPWPSYDSNLLLSDFIRQKPNFQDFDFLEVDPSSKEISVREGYWTLNKSLVVPEDYTFIVNAGTHLNLTNDSRILSYAPIRLIGSEQYPIIIDSSDSSGQGIVILNAGAESFLENVVFENLSEPSQSGWQLTGAITFYESPVTINKCRFLGNNSEDSLNIIRSRFIITNSFFRKTKADALDVDFGRGTIYNTSFVDCGNDAMDFSGSVINISKSFVNGAGDKGISVGECSQVTVRQVEISNSKIGIASKDLSEVGAEDIQVRGGQIGFAVYQKKPEFGPARISVQKATVVDVPTIHLLEERSSLSFDGKKIEGAQKDVAEGIDKL